MSTEPEVATVAEVEAPELVAVAIGDIRRDLELACRARGINKATVREYSASMASGSTFPPVVVFRDSKGVLWLSDGFHRCEAAELAGLAEISADVRRGGRKEALLFAAQANTTNGLRRSAADKRRAIELVLTAFPKWSDRKIADAAGTDHKTVARVRSATAKPEVGEFPQPTGREDSQPESASEVLFKKLGDVERWLRTRVESGAGFELAADGVAKLLADLRTLTAEPKPASAPRKSSRRPAELPG